MNECNGVNRNADEISAQRCNSENEPILPSSSDVTQCSQHGLNDLFKNLEIERKCLCILLSS